MDEEVELIKEILPNVDYAQIRNALAETGELGLAVRQLLYPGSPMICRNGRVSKRTIVSVHSGCGETAIEAARTAIVSVRSAAVSVSDSVPEATVSISFLGNPCKPMIYIEPHPLDAQFCQNIEPRSIIVTDRYDEMDVKAFCSFNQMVLLPFTHETVVKSVQQILVENGVIGQGAVQRKWGDMWREMLCLIPLIHSAYADAIAAVVPSPYSALTNPPASLVSKGGNRIPVRILDRLKHFFETDDPNERLETRAMKRTHD
jgi:hypothetical protein